MGFDNFCSNMYDLGRRRGEKGGARRIRHQLGDNSASGPSFRAIRVCETGNCILFHCYVHATRVQELLCKQQT